VSNSSQRSRIRRAWTSALFMPVNLATATPSSSSPRTLPSMVPHVPVPFDGASNLDRAGPDRLCSLELRARGFGIARIRADQVFHNAKAITTRIAFHAALKAKDPMPAQTGFSSAVPTRGMA